MKDTARTARKDEQSRKKRSPILLDYREAVMVDGISGGPSQIHLAQETHLEVFESTGSERTNGWSSRSTIESLQSKKQENCANSHFCKRLLYIWYWIVYLITFKRVNLFPVEDNSTTASEYTEEERSLIEHTEEDGNLTELPLTELSCDSSEPLIHNPQNETLTEIPPDGLVTFQDDESSAPDIPTEMSHGDLSEMDSEEEQKNVFHLAVHQRYDSPPPESPRIPPSSERYRPQYLAPQNAVPESSSHSDSSVSANGGTSKSSIDESDTSDHERKVGSASSIASDDNDDDDDESPDHVLSSSSGDFFHHEPIELPLRSPFACRSGLVSGQSGPHPATIHSFPLQSSLEQHSTTT